MTPADLLCQAAADGVDITLAPSGKRLRLLGDPEDVERWRAVIAPSYVAPLIAELNRTPAAIAKIGPLSCDLGAGRMLTPAGAEKRGSEARRASE